MTDLEHRVSWVWVVDSYWRTIGTTHLGAPGRLMGGRVGRLAAAWPAGQPLHAWPCIRISIRHTDSIMHERVLIGFIMHGREQTGSVTACIC
eukprot:SAG25_NODE_971_length_4480_cov_26.107053_5_plen_92_part_00